MHLLHPIRNLLAGAGVTRTLHVEQDVTITRVSLSNAEKMKNGSRCKLMALGDGYVSFFFTLVTGPSRSLSLKLSDTRVYEPQIRARLG